MAAYGDAGKARPKPLASSYAGMSADDASLTPVSKSGEIAARTPHSGQFRLCYSSFAPISRRPWGFHAGQGLQADHLVPSFSKAQ
jgi:hypothetical protein